MRHVTSLKLVRYPLFLIKAGQALLRTFDISKTNKKKYHEN
jgi:hypothetical protein